MEQPNIEEDSGSSTKGMMVSVIVLVVLLIVMWVVFQ